jgi:hypothetical protein
VKTPTGSRLRPLMILMGEDDDWTPAPPCHELGSCFPDEITLVTYPGTYHDFDAPNRPVKIREGAATSATGQAHVGTSEPALARHLASRGQNLVNERRDRAQLRLGAVVDGGQNPRKSGDDRNPGMGFAVQRQPLLAVVRSDANRCSVALCPRRQPPKAGAAG